MDLACNTFQNALLSAFFRFFALAQAENVRAQLLRTMEKFEIDLISLEDEKRRNLGELSFFFLLPL